MEEAGMRDFALPGWYGLFAPAGTPREIVELVQREAVRALHLPDVRERIVAVGPVPVGSTSREFETKYKADLEAFAKIVMETRIPLQ